MTHLDFAGRAISLGQPVFMPSEDRTATVWALGRSVSGESVVMIIEGAERLDRRISATIVGLRQARP